MVDCAISGPFPFACLLCRRHGCRCCLAKAHDTLHVSTPHPAHRPPGIVNTPEALRAGQEGKVWDKQTRTWIDDPGTALVSWPGPQVACLSLLALEHADIHT